MDDELKNYSQKYRTPISEAHKKMVEYKKLYHKELKKNERLREEVKASDAYVDEVDDLNKQHYDLWQEAKQENQRLRGLARKYYRRTFTHGKCLFCHMAWIDGWHHTNDCPLANEFEEKDGE
jgi:hypothetical protein